MFTEVHNIRDVRFEVFWRGEVQSKGYRIQNIKLHFQQSDAVILRLKEMPTAMPDKTYYQITPEQDYPLCFSSEVAKTINVKLQLEGAEKGPLPVYIKNRPEFRQGGHYGIFIKNKEKVPTLKFFPLTEEGEKQVFTFADFLVEFTALCPGLEEKVSFFTEINKEEIIREGEEKLGPGWLKQFSQKSLETFRQEGVQFSESCFVDYAGVIFLIELLEKLIRSQNEKLDAVKIALGQKDYEKAFDTAQTIEQIETRDAAYESIALYALAENQTAVVKRAIHKISHPTLQTNIFLASLKEERKEEKEKDLENHSPPTQRMEKNETPLSFTAKVPQKEKPNSPPQQKGDDSCTIS